jgi:hypothetical protein
MAKSIGTEARRKTTAGRFYEIVPGDPYPSVTTILAIINKPALVGWSAKVERQACIKAATDFYRDMLKAFHDTPMEDWKFTGLNAYPIELENYIGKAKQGQKILTEAGQIGTQAHALVEWRIRKMLGHDEPEPEASDEAQWAAMAWEDWAVKHRFEPLHSEMVIWSHKHRYAGTLDFTGYVDGVYSLFDVKTGKAVYSEAFLQCSSYVAGMKECGLDPVPQKAFVLRLPKNMEDPEFEAVEVTDLDKHFEAFLAARALWQWHYNQSQNGE